MHVAHSPRFSASPSPTPSRFDAQTVAVLFVLVRSFGSPAHVLHGPRQRRNDAAYDPTIYHANKHKTH